jgi:hypothetical protein
MKSEESDSIPSGCKKEDVIGGEKEVRPIHLARNLGYCC